MPSTDEGFAKYGFQCSCGAEVAYWMRTPEYPSKGPSEFKSDRVACAQCATDYELRYVIGPDGSRTVVPEPVERG
jgi:hypothetical protein